ncbi:MAG: hypothetical protein ACW99U_19215 [Candidatus Thorarchaeota archaeon]
MTVDRRVAWAQKKKEEGLCISCGKPLGKYKVRCDSCALKKRARDRARQDRSAWRKGKRGRPPIIPD